MNWRRLFQPASPVFWLMLAANVASAALVWIVQTYPVSNLARGVIAIFALGNLLIGLGCARALLRAPDDEDQ